MECILKHYSNSNTAFLHPKGKKATNELLKYLECKENENVLEFGFGTGATLVYFSSLNEKTNFFGLDSNSFMLKKAKERLKFCKIKNVELLLNDKTAPFPFKTNFFDKIYIESVLAIQDNDDLEKQIEELCRILKPNGKLIINEGIWSDNFPLDEIKKMNIFCTSNFGIIQSNEKYPYINDWIQLFKQNSFIVEKTINLNTLSFSKKHIRNTSYKQKLSKFFTLIGYITSKMNFEYIKQNVKYKKAMKITSNKGNFLIGYLIVLKK